MSVNDFVEFFLRLRMFGSIFHTSACMNPNSGVHACPVEVLWRIFLELRPEYRSILRCRAVCRRFLDSIDASVEVQLALRLDSWGYEEPLDSEREPRSHVLRKLDAHVDAWRTLNWDETRIQIPRGSEIACDLAHGVFVSLDIDAEGTMVTCVSLPSRLTGSGISLRKMALLDVGVLSEILAVDPSQDLIVLNESRDLEAVLHFRRLSDGLPFTGPISVLDRGPYPQQLQIFEHIVGFTWLRDENEVLFDAWNWKTGELIWRTHRTFEQFTYCIISSNAILISCQHSTSHGRCTFGLQTWEFSSTKLSGKLMSTFALHAFTPTERPLRVYIEGDRTPPRTSSAPFQSAEESRMVKLVCGPSYASRKSHKIFVPASLFTEDFGYPPASPIPYFVWSSGRARLVQETNRSGRTSSGRHVHLQSPRTLQVYDFNLQRCGRNRTDPPLTAALVRGPQSSSTQTDETSRNDQSYSLPYWKVWRTFGRSGFEVREESDGVLRIDEEHIVLVNSDHAGNRETDELVILTF